MSNRTTGTTVFWQLLWVAVIGCVFPLSGAASSYEEVPIPAAAQDVHRSYSNESKWREISYHVRFPYPQTAISDSDFKRLENRGWLQCSGYHVGWDSYVDASRGSGHDRTVFQNVSYWSKGSALLAIAIIYYAGVTKEGWVVANPGNTNQYVSVIEYHNHNEAIEKALKLSCST
jgi:hypothetical protein